MPRKLALIIDVDDLNRLISGLDSREYWELSDEDARNDGYVIGDGSDDAESAAEIAASRALAERLEALRQHARATFCPRVASDAVIYGHGHAGPVTP